MFQRKLLFICEVNLLPNILKYLNYCYIIIELACYSIYKILTKMPWVDCHIFLDNIGIMIEWDFLSCAVRAVMNLSYLVLMCLILDFVILVKFYPPNEHIFCTVAHTITSTILIVGFLIGNVKVRHLCHEVAVDHFCGQATPESFVYCFYFNADVEMHEKYVSTWRMLLYMETFTLLLYLSLLSFHFPRFLVTANIYMWLCIHPLEFLKYLVLWRHHLIWYVIPNKSSLGMIHLIWLNW